MNVVWNISLWFICVSDPTIKFWSIPERVNVKPCKDAWSVHYYVLNWREMCVFIKLWITSNLIFSRGVSSRASVLISSSELYSKYCLTMRVFLVTLFLPLLLECTAEIILMPSKCTTTLSWYEAPPKISRGS